MEVNNLGLYIVGSFLVINLLLGLWAGRDVKDIRDYAIGNKRWGVGNVIISYLGTVFSGSNLFRISRYYFNYGIFGFAGTLGSIIATFVRYFFIADRMSEFTGCITMGDVIEKLYGQSAKKISAIISAIYSTIITAMQIHLLAIIFNYFCGSNVNLSVYFAAFCVVVYTAMGGIRAIKASGVFQFLFLLIGLLFLLSIIVREAGGLKSVINSYSSFEFTSVSNKNFAYIFSIFLLEIFMSSEILEPAHFQRVLLARNSLDLKKLFFFVQVGWIIYTCSLALIAFSLKKIGLDSDENLILIAISKYAPLTLQPIIIISLISFVFSTAESCMHNASLTLYKDFIAYFIPKNKNPILYVRLTTIFLGLLSCYLGFFNIAFLRIDYVLGIMSSTICIPLIMGIFGIRLQKQDFWAPCLFGGLFFIISIFGFLGSFYLDNATLVSSLSNLIIYLLIALKRYNERIDIFKIFNKFNYLRNKVFDFRFLTHFIGFCEEKVGIYGAPYKLFAFFYVGVIVILGLIDDSLVKLNQNILSFNLIAFLLCSLLITNSIWPSFLKKYRPAFWYITLTYCLPFLSTIMLIMSHGAMEYTINVAINIMFLLLLVDWASAIGIGIVGTSAAIGYYKFFIQIDPSETIFGFETKYLLIYQIIFGTIIGLLFARKKHIRIKSLDENTDFLEELQQNIIETNNMSIAIAEDANRTPENINLHPAENVEALKNLLQEKNLLSSEISQKITELEIFIAAEEKNISPYMFLNADKVDLLKISQKFESFSKACACENTYVSIYSKEKTVKWDSAQIIKCVGKLAQNYYNKMKTFYDEDSDIFLNIALIDTKIKYISATDSKISREINGLAIVLSENENLEDTFTNKNFEKVMIDPEKIPSTRLTDHKMIDIERTIDAHYGILQTIEDKENLSYICVFPINVYDIRPITLDLDSPNISDLSYNWPAAEELEVKFWEKVSSLNQISTNKIKKAIDYIKIYHRHQTRKSGEPYYLHPMSVAMIAIDIAQQNSEIHTLLLQNIENVILVSLLHDILEDTYIKRKNILQNFGGEVLRYIESVTKTDFKQREWLLSNDLAFTKLINQEPITICVKIADRIHNLQTIDGHIKVEKRIAVAEETLIFFTQAARKYGMIELSEKLTSMCNYILKNEKIENWNR